jgi:hypothetical protein
MNSLVFIDNWADIAARLVSTFAIVEHFDVVEDRGVSLVAIFKVAVPRQIAEEAFGDGIVETFALTTHARPAPAGRLGMMQSSTPLLDRCDGPVLYAEDDARLPS